MNAPECVGGFAERSDKAGVSSPSAKPLQSGVPSMVYDGGRRMKSPTGAAKTEIFSFTSEKLDLKLGNVGLAHHKYESPTTRPCGFPQNGGSGVELVQFSLCRLRMGRFCMIGAKRFIEQSE